MDLTRRQFLQGGAVVGAGLVGRRGLSRVARLRARQPRVVVDWSHGCLRLPCTPTTSWSRCGTTEMARRPACSIAAGRSAYSYWRTGKTTSFGGYEGVPEGGVYFCGEHTSFNFQGYMEGAVRSGRRAADEVADSLMRASGGERVVPNPS